MQLRAACRRGGGRAVALGALVCHEWEGARSCSPEAGAPQPGPRFKVGLLSCAPRGGKIPQPGALSGEQKLVVRP